MKTQSFKIQNRYGLEIVGDIFVSDESKGISFVLHGLGGYRQHTNNQAILDTLLKNNYTVVTFDATNSVGESEGKYEDATVTKHYEDLCDVIDWSKKQDFYTESIFLAGHSLGGYAVLKYAEDYPVNIKSVFAFAPFIAGELSFEAHRIFEKEKFEEWEKTGWITIPSESKPGLEKKLPWSHMVERLNHDLRPNTDKLTMPILIIVGEKDTSCPPVHQKIFFDLIPEGRKELHIVPDASHTFREEKHLNELKNILNIWLQKIK